VANTSTEAATARLTEEPVWEEIKLDKARKMSYFYENGELAGTASSSLMVRYPQARQWADTAAMASLNQLLSGYIDESLRVFKQQGGLGLSDAETPDSLRLSAADASYFSEQGLSSSLDIHYQIGVELPALKGIWFETSTYLGGAHALPGYHYINFDMENRRNIRLQDIFKDNSDFLRQLSLLCFQELSSRMEAISSDSAWISNGVAPQLKNFTLYRIEPHGITFVFEPYQVAPYTSGVQTVTLPYSRLEPLLVPGTLIQKIRK
jgi:hypothetical protein